MMNQPRGSINKKNIIKKAVLLSMGGALLMSISSGAEEVYSLPEMVVTAEKMPVESKKEPQAVQVVDQKEIESLGAVNATQALELVTGINLSSGKAGSTASMGGTQVMLRGMNTNQVLILVDGRRMADEDTSQTKNAYLLSRIPLSTIDKIEVVRGPSGAMYGSDGMGGVINIITKKPDKEETVLGFHTGEAEWGEDLRYTTGKLGRWNSSFHYSTAKVRPLSYRNQGTDERGIITDGWDVPGYGRRQEIGLDTVYDFENRNENKVRFGVNYFDESMLTRFADGGMQMGRLYLPLQKDDRSRIDRHETDTFLTYTGKTDRNEYEGSVSYSRLTKNSKTSNDRPDFTGILPPFVNSMLDTLYPAGDYDKAEYTEWALSGKDTMTFDKHRVTYGGDYRMTSYTGTRLGEGKEEEGHSIENAALYVTDFWTMGGGVTLTPSFRMEHNNRFGDYGVPRLGATWELDPHNRIKADYGAGYRAPTVSEMYLNLNHFAYRIYGNPDLSPEKSRSLDLSYEWELGNLKGKVTWFKNRVKNLIDIVQVSDAVYHYENVNRADIEGVETELSALMGSRWNWRLSHVYLDAENKTDGTMLDNRARHTVTAALFYDDHDDYGWSGAIWDTFQDHYRFDDEAYTFQTLNTSIRKRWDDWSMTAGVYNWLDKKVDDLYVHGREWFTGMQVRL